MNTYFKQTTGYLILAASLFSYTTVQAQEHKQHNMQHQHEQAHEHNHEQAQQGAMHLNKKGQRWQTDAPLRQGMERIRVAVNNAQQLQTVGEMDEKEAQALVAETEGGITYMFQNCKLEGEADANLHVLLSRLMSANDAVKADPNSDAGVPAMLEALKDYPKYFKHAGW